LSRVNLLVKSFPTLKKVYTTKNFVKYKSYLKYKLAVMTAIFCGYGGTGTAIYPAATMHNMAVFDETSQHPPFNALCK